MFKKIIWGIFLLGIANSLLHGQDTLIITNDDLQTTTTWLQNKVYVLDGEVTLENGTLVIQSGTKILAKTTPSDPNQPSSGLTIAPGARIIARGTSDQPIVFTTDQTGFLSPAASRGSWRGLSLQGGANNSLYSILSYVSIQYAGASLDGISGAALFLENISRQSDFEFIEVYASAGDGIRIHGGEAELAYTSVMFAKDDAYDWDYGWVGAGLYWLAYHVGRYQDDDFFNEKSYAIEGKGNPDENGRIANPKIYNATLIGNSCGWSWGGYDVDNIGNEAAVGFKDNSAGLLANSLIIDFPEKGIHVEDLPTGPDCRQQVKNGSLQILNNVWWSKQNVQDIFGFSPTRQLNNGEKGIILTDVVAEDTNAQFLVNHLQDNGNVIAGIGLWANRAAANCIALDPRPHPNSHYNELPNFPYPEDSFFTELIKNGNQKGAFPSDAIWLEDWTTFGRTYDVGESAQTYFYYKERINENDTIKVYCEELADFHHSIGYNYPCFPIIILTSAASRRGNKRRPARDKSGDEELIAFVEDWRYSALNHGCEGPNITNFTLLVYDTLPPIIHPIPDRKGGLSAIVEDCDDAWITNSTVDTITNNQGQACIRYHFYAEDYSGNISDLIVDKKISGALITLYADMDQDGFGNPYVSIESYGPLTGFVDNALDCNDNNPLVQGINSNSSDECQSDICEQAPLVSIDSGYEFSFSRASKTIYPLPLEDCGFYNTFSDLWFQFEAPASGGVFVDIGHGGFSEGYGIVAELYSGNCHDLQLVDCMYDVPSIFTPLDNLVPGSNYYVRLYEPSNIHSSEITVRLLEVDSVANNPICDLSITLDDMLNTCDSRIFKTGKISRYTYSDTDCRLQSGDAYWFSYVPETADTIEISLELMGEGPLNSGMILYRSSCSALEQIDCFNELDLSNSIMLSPALFAPGEVIFIQILTSRNENSYEIQVCQSASTATPVDELMGDSPSVRVYPNPTHSGTILTLEMQLPERVNRLHCQLSDTQGRLVQDIFDQSVVAGDFRYSTMLNGLPAGIYLLQVRSEDFSVTRKIVILK